MSNYFHRDTRILSNIGALKINDLIDTPRDLEVVDFAGDFQKTTISKSKEKVKFVKIKFKNGQAILMSPDSSLLIYNGDSGVRKLDHPISKFLYEDVGNLKKDDKVYHIRKTNPVSDVKRRSSRSDGLHSAGSHFKDSLPPSLWKRNHAYVEGALEFYVRRFGNLNVNMSYYSRCYLWFKKREENILRELQQLFTFYGIRSNMFYNDAEYTYQLYMMGDDLKYFIQRFEIESRSFVYRVNRLKKLKKPTPHPFLQIEEVEETDITDYAYTINTETFFTEVGITGNK